MTQVTVLNGQTLFDLALQCCGDTGAAYDIAVLNDIEVTSYPAAGTVLAVPDPYNKKVYNHYTTNNIKPATAYNN